eukprot:2909421-Pyramimonas_sp.AAC.1
MPRTPEKLPRGAGQHLRELMESHFMVAGNTDGRMCRFLRGVEGASSRIDCVSYCLAMFTW